MGWYAVDLDGTLARYDGWQGAHSIGAPIPTMVERVRRWLAKGREVRVFTARVAVEDPALKLEIVATIQDWCEQHIGRRLAVTNVKDFGMIELWDDRAVQVVPNTGVPVGRVHEEE